MAATNYKSEAELEKLLQGAILVLPKTTNPFTAFLTYFEQSVSFKTLSSTPPLLIGGSVLLAISSIIYVTGLAVRWKKGTLWFFRIVTVGRERFILPNYIVTYVTFMIFFILCLQTFVWTLWAEAKDETLIRNYFLATCLPWIPGVIAVCLGAWSLTVTWILHLRTYSNSANPWYLSSRLVNTVGILLPFLVVASLLPPSLTASNRLNLALSTTTKVATNLVVAQAEWSPGTPIDREDIHYLAIDLYSVTQYFNSFKRDFAILFAILATWCAILGVGFVSVGVMYLSALRKSIREMQGRTKTGVETFARTLRWLTVITVSLGVTMIALAVVTAWIAATIDAILTEAKSSQFSSVIPVYTIAILGVPVSCILLYHALSTQIFSRSSLDSSSTGTNPNQSRFGFPRATTKFGATSSMTNSQDSPINRQQQYITQHNLATGLPFELFTMSGPSILDHQGEQALPFDSLELHPTNVNVHNEGGGGNSTRPSGQFGRSRSFKKQTNGIVVERVQEVVTVVALPKDGHLDDNEFGGEGRSKWEEDNKW